MRLCLYQPEIPENTGTLLRVAACWGIGVDIIRPCGFALSHRRLKRAGMDYIDHVDVRFYDDWSEIKATRLVLLSTHAAISYTNFRYAPTDTLMLGRESRGVPPEIEDQIPHRVRIPMQKDARSLNLAISASVVLGEALRQQGVFNNVDF